jgi:hypothetical protein
MNYQNTVWRNNGAIAASSDGAFHPVWIESGNGEGQLRTATITVGRSAHSELMPSTFDEKGCDVTRQVAILYGGDQHYDSSSDLLNVMVVLRNKGTERLRAPVLLKTEALTSAAFKLEIANSDNGQSGAGAIWDLTPAIPGGILNAGTTSKPYLLQFRVTPIKEILTDEVFSLRLKALSCVSAPK